MTGEVAKIRQHLHRFPELSGYETATTAYLYALLQSSSPDQLVKGFGDKGLWAVYESGNPGPCLLFRADIDALPIDETTDLLWKSQYSGVSHKCGHDGHAAILAGFAGRAGAHRPARGKLVLLFQPAEETGEGAPAMLEQLQQYGIIPDFAFAMHNLPGFPHGSVVVREGTFAAASRGMIFKLKGRVSHASEPEKGQSPAAVMAHLMSHLPRLTTGNAREKFEDFVLLTIIHANLGMPSFGTSPGDALLMATLRSYKNEDMELMCHLAERLAQKAVAAAGLTLEISYTEEFPAMINHHEPVAMVRNAAVSCGLEPINAILPFRWSEDFAHFGLAGKAVLFGIGAGEKQLPLHHPDYDFPDSISETALKVWEKLYEALI